MKVVFSAARAQGVIEQAWLLIGNAQIRESRILSEELVREIQDALERSHEGDTELLRSLTSACYVAGYSTGMSVRNHESLLAVSYFDEMLHAAHELQDDTCSVIALTYQGDMYRRYGDLAAALHCLQAAYAISQLDQAAHGNCAQLLGRLYSQMGESEKFTCMMEEAEQIARSTEPSATSLHGQYCLGTVYIDYSKHYCKVGETYKAFDYFARAEKSFPATPHWHTLLTATHGLLLVRSGKLAQGIPYIDQAVKLALDHGNYRLLDHFQALQHYLAQKSIEFNKASVHLGQLLNVPYSLSQLL